MPAVFSPSAGPRAVTDADFPQDGPPEAQLAVMLNWAVQAPSVLNTQPWRFRVSGPEVEVFVDRARVVRSVDPEAREAVVSCGAALFTLRLAAHHYGFATIETAPAASDDPDLVARLRLAGPSRATEAEEALFRAIRHRHTNRDPYADFAVPGALLDAFRAAAEDEGVHLHVVQGEAERGALADLVAEAIRAQGEDEATVAELRAWLRPTGDARADGVPDDVQGGWDRLSYLRTEARFLAAEARRLAHAAPALLVISTATDRRADWVRAGAALQRVLLLGAAEGLAASYFNQPTEVAALRPEVAAIAGHGHPQVVFRLGTPVEATGTPRRRVADVLRPGDPVV
ncbi:MAG: nitroreductase family protein [Bacteroidota bacterium]